MEGDRAFSQHRLQACVYGTAYDWIFKGAVKSGLSTEDAMAQAPLSEKWDEVKKLLKGDVVRASCSNDDGNEVLFPFPSLSHPPTDPSTRPPTRPPTDPHV